MEDRAIVALFHDRDEAAIEATAQKYGRYLTAIASRILPDPEDCRESVNDVYYRAWESIPPADPPRLGVFLGRIARQIAIDRWRRLRSQKRGEGEYPVALSELEVCHTYGDTSAAEADARLMAEAIGAYLRTLPTETRAIFICRYYDLISVRELAERFHCGESRITTLLQRTRQGLSAHLRKEGFDL